MGAELTATMFPPKKESKRKGPPPSKHRPVNTGGGGDVCDTCGQPLIRQTAKPNRCNRCSDGIAWLVNLKKKNLAAYRVFISSL